MDTIRAFIKNRQGLLFQAFFPLTSATPNTNIGSLSGFFTPSSLPGLFNAIFTMAISAGAILAVIRLAYAGWLYMGSADMWGNKSQAKEIFRNAIIGLLLLLAIYLILNLIDPCLLDLNILRSLQNQTCTLQ